MSSHEPDKDHLWDYFNAAARQRVQFFYFFVIISGFFATGLTATESILHEMPDENASYLAEMFVLCFYLGVSIVFRLLELRSQALVNHGEECIKVYGSENDKKIFWQEKDTLCYVFGKASLGRAYTGFFWLFFASTIISFLYFFTEEINCHKDNNDVFLALVAFTIFLFLIIIKFILLVCGVKPYQRAPSSYTT